MDKFFISKLNILLLFILTVSGGFCIILNVEATDTRFIKDDSGEGLSLEQKIQKGMSEFETNTVSSDLKYVLRANEEEHPLGYVDSTFIRCFVDMGSVDFAPRYKYKSQNINGESWRTYGFSTPLVGDLNGDGKPEIVVLGIRDSQDGLSATATYIYVFNGQTGKVIAKYTLPITWNLRGDSYHGSPCQLALFKLNKEDKYARIVCALGYASGTTEAPYRKRVICWEMNETTFNESIDPTLNSKFTHKWTSDVRYDAYGTNNASIRDSHDNYSKPIPHIVDIDGNGVPEIIVYNKIYDAATGTLIMKLDDLASSNSSATAYVGQNRVASYGDDNIPFAYIYDIDFDNKYDIVAGGKVYYDIDLTAKTYKTKTMSGVADGYTAVADINSDGLPEVVMASYESSYRSSIIINVWTPNLVKKEGGNIVPGTDEPALLASRTFRVNSSSTGNHSNIFVGDIDGKIQNGKKFPEISVLSGIYNDLSNIPVHPNCVGTLPNNTNYTSGTEGHLISFTWDDNETDISKKLKVSFILEHDDSSTNTGFTLFDFDNDGVQDICYRDEQSLRIISASKPLVRLNETSTDVIRFKQNVRSYTGFENPVVADIDGDASSDMIVLGRETTSNSDHSFVYAVEGAHGDLAPAPKVWNQYSYSPLKVNEDLTIPKTVFHPLDEKYAYYLSESDRDNDVKTYIYNNTIAQVPIFSVSPDRVVRPIVSTPDVQVLNPAIRINGVTSGVLTFSLTNTGNSTVNPEIPINIYLNGVYNSGLSTVVGSGGLFVNETLSYSINITDPFSVYKIIVGAKVDNANNLLPDSKYEDCNWADNMDEIATFLPKDDAATVVQYGSAIIDVLANDILQDECLVQTLTKGIITTPGGVGVMSGDFGSVQIVNNKLLYTAPASYPGGVVKLSYKLTCSGAEKTANVYIYVLESCSFGFASCAGSPYNVCLKENPSGIKFGWYSSANDADYIGDSSPNIPSLMTDMAYYVKPNFDAISASPYKMVQFPKGKITIKVLNSTEKLKAKWTGEVDSDWHNPGNWAQVLTNGSEIPVTWAPIGCVNVVIPSGAARYPELKSVAECSHIHMEDRAMISGIHNLVYAEASVDMTFTSSEKNRFVMWSAPLKDMYTGDYHFLNSTAQPDWGHVYMNFFQSANPDYAGSVEKEKTFTSTFGSTGAPLPLGKAFNVKVLSGKNQGFTFPKTATVYTDANNTTTGNLSRMNAKRFITDGAINANGDITIPVSGNNKYSLIQVVNPFMAYLKVNEFLAANPDVIESSYSLWNGDVNAEFISVLSLNDDKEQRYVIDDFSRLTYESTGYIAPLQSFFVKKRSSEMSITTLAMNASMTTTSIPNTQSSYVLRSAVRGEEIPDLLRITASSGDEENSTVILRKRGAKQEYSFEEDVEKVFNHGVPVSVYTMTSTKKALAINVSDNFSGDVKLGIRVRDVKSPLTLSFSGLNNFAQDVSLIDHALNDKEIDVQKESDYVFAVQQGSAEVTEINDRFSLRFRSNSTGIKSVVNDEIKVVADKKRIDVSFSSIFDRVEIINLSGLRVHDSAIPASYTQIPVIGGQVYLVRVTVGSKQIVKKVYVK